MFPTTSVTVHITEYNPTAVELVKEGSLLVELLMRFGAALPEGAMTDHR
jgi:hypothetical protein